MTSCAPEASSVMKWHWVTQQVEQYYAVILLVAKIRTVLHWVTILPKADWSAVHAPQVNKSTYSVCSNWRSRPISWMWQTIVFVRKHLKHVLYYYSQVARDTPAKEYRATWLNWSPQQLRLAFLTASIFHSLALWWKNPIKVIQWWWWISTPWVW